MELRVGVVGTGSIGRDHIRRISTRCGGARVVAVADVNAAAARQTAEEYEARPFDRGEDLIAAQEVDAVLVASSDATHEPYVLEAIGRGKPVFCEKPLTPGPDGSRRIVDAEIAAGRHLVQVGYMRRYDPGYLQLKRVIGSGRLGAPLMVHCAHRNRTAGRGYRTAMAVESSAVHELDILRWLLGEEYTSARVIFPKRTRHCPERQQDPQVILLETRSGVHIDIEVFLNCRYGYDIKCEVCCEDGTIALPEPSNAVVRESGARSVEIFPDWIRRFEAAYDLEIQDWIDGARAGKVAGPNAWDGYAAAFAAACCGQARDSGAQVPIGLAATPAFYR